MNNPKTRRLSRSRHNRIIAGVCGGIGEYYAIDPFWIRLLLIILLFPMGGLPIIAYLVLWLLMPEINAEEPEVIIAKKTLYRSRRHRLIGGVCGGMADYFDVDATWVRLAFVLLTLMVGYGLLLYLIMWMIIPAD